MPLDRGPPAKHVGFRLVDDVQRRQPDNGSRPKAVRRYFNFRAEKRSHARVLPAYRSRRFSTFRSFV